jgi:hypothetical protein
MKGLSTEMPVYVCDVCLRDMSFAPYVSEQGSHLCWECVGPHVTPTYPGDARGQYVTPGTTEPVRNGQIKIRRRLESYQECSLHAVPCDDTYDHYYSDWHKAYDSPAGGRCCYYCCDTCKAKCSDPVTKQKPLRHR